MDVITERQVELFAGEYSLQDRSQDEQFEHFAAFATVKRHYDRTFVPDDIVVGSGGDTGIDAVAVIVNNVLIDDIDTLNELAEQNGYIDATFIFIQAEQGGHFDGNKITNLQNGVVDFFRDQPKLVRNSRIQAASEIGAAVYEKIGMFRQRPALICYYVTTGQWQNDQNLVARCTVAKEEFARMEIFSTIDYECFGRDEIQRAYNQTRNPISREFIFANRTDLPATPGVAQAFLGFIPYSAFKSIVSEPISNNILG